MIENIFKQQPGYNKDLQHAIQSIQDVSLCLTTDVRDRGLSEKFLIFCITEKSF
jgi:hypothetical protein